MTKSDNSAVRTAKYLSIIIDPQDHLRILHYDLDHDLRREAHIRLNHDLQREAQIRRLTHLRVVHRPRHPMMAYQIYHPDYHQTKMSKISNYYTSTLTKSYNLPTMHWRTLYNFKIRTNYASYDGGSMKWHHNMTYLEHAKLKPKYRFRI